MRAARLTEALKRLLEEAARLTEALKRLLEEHTDCASCDACQPAHDILHPDLLTERRQEFKAQLAKKP